MEYRLWDTGFGQPSLEYRPWDTNLGATILGYGPWNTGLGIGLFSNSWTCFHQLPLFQNLGWILSIKLIFIITDHYIDWSICYIKQAWAFDMLNSLQIYFGAVNVLTSGCREKDCTHQNILLRAIPATFTQPPHVNHLGILQIQ